jgi:hypothetical protein
MASTKKAIKDEVTGATLDKPKGVIEGLKRISIGELNVTIRGLSSLIVHAWGKKALEEMLSSQQMTKEEKKLAKQNRDKKDPEMDFNQARYVINGKDSFPTIAVKKAMVDAGAALGISRVVIRQAVFILGDYFEIKGASPVRREDTVRVGPFGNRQADLRYRPEYQGWSADLQFRYRTDMIDEDQLLALLENAGFSVGIGEWRPQKDGQFGTFEVVA